MQFERDESSALERFCARVALGGTRPYAILGCTYPFDGSIFGEILDHITEALQLDDTDLARIPIDVVCDRALYRGHAIDKRFRVHLYPQEELFHSKLLIVLLEQEIVWLSGSGNITRAGYCSNREIALLHEPGDRKLPAPLRRLLARLPGDAAQVIRKATTDSRSGSLRGGRFQSSMDGPIGRRFLYRPPRKVEEVHILAPFFEQFASVDSLDHGWLETLRQQFPSAEYRIYLPLLESGRKPLVQGDRALFERFADQLRDRDQLRFHPVPSDPGPLHGKLVAITYRSGSGRRARVLVGSPNPSRRALLAPRRNVEVAWIADIKASSLSAFISHLDSGDGRRIDMIRFEPPKYTSEHVWSVLSRAVLDPRTRTLSLTWLREHGRHDTEVLYGKKRLIVGSDDRVQAFELDAAHGALTTRANRKVKGRVIPGYCPVEVPLADQMLLGTFDDAMTPEDWLQMLGQDPGSGLERGGAGLRKLERDARRGPTAFEPSDQVRDLAARVRHTLQRLREPFWSEAERDATLRVLRGIFDSHEPGAADLSMAQRIWRAWVRAELVQFTSSAAKDRAVRTQRLGQTLRDLSIEFWRRLDIRLLAPPVRKQIRFVARGMS